MSCQWNVTPIVTLQYSHPSQLGWLDKLRYIHLPHLIRMVYAALNNKELGLRS